MRLLAIITCLCLASCQSTYVQVTDSAYSSGAPDRSTGHASGLEVGTVLGAEQVGLDIGARYGRTTDTRLDTEQFTAHAGVRFSSPSDWMAAPYVSAGMAAQYHILETERDEVTEPDFGTYVRLGVQVPLTDYVAIDMAYELTDMGESSVGGRRNIDLKTDALLVGVSFSF